MSTRAFAEPSTETPRRSATAIGLSWDNDGKGRLTALIAFYTLVAMLIAIPGAATAAPAPVADVVAAGDTVSVIVQETPDALDQAERFVEAAGGTVGAALDIIEAFVADVPADSVATLASLPTVRSVSRNAKVKLLGWDTSPGQTRNTMDRLVDTVLDADRFWNDGFHGQGVDVALIDSGVVPVEGLTLPGKIVNGPDLSFESQSDNLRYLDTYGHGTHLAGIIAGNDGATASITTNSVKQGFLGVAPEARIVSIKVADAHGNTDVSQVIAAIDWVVQHKNDNGLNIRVLNLSFGTDSIQDYRIDPLAYAVEVAWEHGIVVVVAAGNDGNSSALRNPATNPNVIAVGALDPNGSAKTNDDWQPGFSSCGTPSRHVDVVAPGKSVVSLRAPGSTADIDHEGARFDDRFFKGSGTSQAAAFVSGAAALLISQRPDLNPDQVKALLTSTAVGHSWITTTCEGSGLIDLGEAVGAATPSAASAAQNHEPATGTGSLEAARGTMHVSMDGVLLTGEQDILGSYWDGASWSGASWSGASWSSGEWNGASWSGASWSGASWSGASWSGASWSGASWSGASWSGASWSSNTWNGGSWSGGSWSGSSWSGSSWSASGWLSSGQA
jgi:serine protease AprX